VAKTTNQAASDINVVLRNLGVTSKYQVDDEGNALDQHNRLVKAMWRLAELANNTLMAGVSTADVDRWDRSERPRLKPAPERCKTCGETVMPRRTRGTRK